MLDADTTRHFRPAQPSSTPASSGAPTPGAADLPVVMGSAVVAPPAGMGAPPVVTAALAAESASDLYQSVAHLDARAAQDRDEYARHKEYLRTVQGSCRAAIDNVGALAHAVSTLGAAMHKMQEVFGELYDTAPRQHRHSAMTAALAEWGDGAARFSRPLEPKSCVHEADDAVRSVAELREALRADVVPPLRKLLQDADKAADLKAPRRYAAQAYDDARAAVRKKEQQYADKGKALGESKKVGDLREKMFTQRTAFEAEAGCFAGAVRGVQSEQYSLMSTAMAALHRHALSALQVVTDICEQTGQLCGEAPKPAAVPVHHAAAPRRIDLPKDLPIETTTLTSPGPVPVSPAAAPPCTAAVALNDDGTVAEGLPVPQGPMVPDDTMEEEYYRMLEADRAARAPPPPADDDDEDVGGFVPRTVHRDGWHHLIMTEASDDEEKERRRRNDATLAATLAERKKRAAAQGRMQHSGAKPPAKAPAGKGAKAPAAKPAAKAPKAPVPKAAAPKTAPKAAPKPAAAQATPAPLPPARDSPPLAGVTMAPRSAKMNGRKGRRGSGAVVSADDAAPAKAQPMRDAGHGVGGAAYLHGAPLGNVGPGPAASWSGSHAGSDVVPLHSPVPVEDPDEFAV